MLVTEPHSELNAGLVVVFSSSHPSIFDSGEWTRRCRRLPGTEFNSLFASASEKVVKKFNRFLAQDSCRPPLCRNLLLPQFCCLIHLCKLQVMACPRDFHYHFCVAD